MGTMNKRKKKQMSKMSSNPMIGKSHASTNPHRPDPSGGKAGSQFRSR